MQWNTENIVISVTQLQIKQILISNNPQRVDMPQKRIIELKQDWLSLKCLTLEVKINRFILKAFYAA